MNLFRLLDHGIPALSLRSFRFPDVLRHDQAVRMRHPSVHSRDQPARVLSQRPKRRAKPVFPFSGLHVTSTKLDIAPAQCSKT